MSEDKLSNWIGRKINRFAGLLNVMRKYKNVRFIAVTIVTAYMLAYLGYMVMFYSFNNYQYLNLEIIGSLLFIVAFFIFMGLVFKKKVKSQSK